MSDARKLSLIAARSRNGFIGLKGGLPWNVPEDLAFFKRTTIGHAVIMGRKTYEEVRRPLPKRTNIVVTRNPGYEAPGCIVVSSLEEALLKVPEDDDEPFVIGGAELYRLALPVADRLYLTEIDRDVEGDTSFPPFEHLGYVEVARRAGETEGVTFATYERSAK